MWMIVEDSGRKEYQPMAETFIFAFLCLFNNKPKIVTNRDFIWSPQFFCIICVSRQVKVNPTYLRTKLFSQRNFMIHLCTILYQSRENVYGRVNQAICVYMRTDMHVCELSLQDKKFLWWFKKRLGYQGEWIATVFWIAVLFPDGIQR